MPPAFGSAPTCPRCSKPVYFAEQTLGPGGVAFHKPCLKCTACGRLLEPRLLVDHEGEAYCKPCHGKAFGAKGYGAGGALVGEYAPSPSASSPANSSPSRARPAPPPKPDFDEDDTRDSPYDLSSLVNVVPKIVPRSSAPPPPPARPVQLAQDPVMEKEKPASTSSFDEEETRRAPSALPSSAPSLPPPVPITASVPSTSSPTRRVAPPPLAPKPKPPLAAKPAPASSTAPSPGSAPSDPSAPHPRPADSSSTATSNTLRTIPLSTSSYASPPRFPASGAGAGGGSSPARNKDLCPRCNTVVYFAEEVRAVGAKWHKRCLRCSSCSTTLSPNTLTEKEGQPYCKKCYGETWGLGGMGVATRPALY
ncbi:hypothetical protein JCM11251_007658 [Rhodosporidiobolus azoricus]